MRKLSAIVFFLSLLSFQSLACTPCQGLSNITQNLNGTVLELNFTSNAGWQCCYTVQIEIVCASSNFTGTPNYFSPELCINGGAAASSTWSTPVPYPTTFINVADFCPGEYKWRARETTCNLGWTSEYTFTIEGASPMIVTAVAAEDEICNGESTLLTATAENGCNGPYSFSWSPTIGVTGANTATPTVAPTTTTTYTVTVTEPGSCATTQTQEVTVVVNPLPTASVTDNVAVCLGDDEPTVTFNGANGTAPYTISYTVNGDPQTPLVTTGNSASVTAPTDEVGFFNYQLVSITDASSTQCSQDQNTYITVTVWDLPVINAGEDVEICEPNATSPSEVTLSGSGGISYTWDNDVVNGVPFTPPSGTTVYTVTGTDFNGCSNTDQLTVYSFPLPIANASASPVYGNYPMTVSFDNMSQLANTYGWNFGNGQTLDLTNTADVSTTYNTPGTYTVTLLASNGLCYDIWTLDIEVLPPMIVTPPNVFTPNGDGANDLYFVDVKYGEKFYGEIFNRWGNYIDKIEGINVGWDGKTEGGKDVEDGTYFIKYKATDYNGNEVEGHTYFQLFR